MTEKRALGAERTEHKKAAAPVVPARGDNGDEEATANKRTCVAFTARKPKKERRANDYPHEQSLLS